ncbi:MAG: phosphoribosylanthranilate isomerase [bacterium]|nr:phosphoribosylanthranilate isomerase [bacterium]
MKNVRIKICGITCVEDAEAAVDLGADFIGLNFWSKSPRRLEAVRGREIAEAVRGRTSLVGVFVNQAQPEVEKVATTVGLDLIQFHGDETPEDLVPWGERAMKAVRFSGELDPEALDDYKTVWGFLIEPQRDSYGGTGRSWNYSKARRLPRHKPFLLAGGLRPENVGQAIEACSPWGVDVCSGIESEPGVKDAQAMWKFFSEVNLATG